VASLTSQNIRKREKGGGRVPFTEGGKKTFRREEKEGTIGTMEQKGELNRWGVWTSQCRNGPERETGKRKPGVAESKPCGGK